MSETWESAIASMMTVIAQIADGNLRARLQYGEDTPEPLRGLADGVNKIVLAWRAAELQSRKTKRSLEEKVATVEAQAVAIRELSTPIMQIWKDVLLLPIVGGIDERRGVEITDELLKRIVQTQARRVIIDITGVEYVDELTADHLLRLVRSSRLVGAQCVVTGMSPPVAQTFVSIGADLGELRTLRTLEQGLVESMAERSS